MLLIFILVAAVITVFGPQKMEDIMAFIKLFDSEALIIEVKKRQTNTYFQLKDNKIR